jgi:hypothetical protein
LASTDPILNFLDDIFMSHQDEQDEPKTEGISAFSRQVAFSVHDGAMVEKLKTDRHTI